MPHHLSLRRARLRLLTVAVAALAAASLHAAPEWKADTFYPAGTIVSYEGRDYRAVVDQVDHSQSGWNPTVPSLWAPVGADNTPPPAPGPSPSPSPSPSPGCGTPWNSGTAYSGGALVSAQGATYRANWWTQGQEPTSHNGSAGSGQPWTRVDSCGSNPPPPGPTPPPPPPPPPPPGPTPPPPPPPGPTPPPPPPPPPPPGPPPPSPQGFLFGPYKDVTINMDWNTNVISTAVPGSRQPLLDALPSGVRTVTWSFATGECGQETWGGLQPAALAQANVQRFVSAGKNYIISTGGAAGAFTCSSDAGFEAFLQNYDSPHLVGVDFDIEGGQGQDVINDLVQRAIAAQRNHPRLRFSFTLATLGGNSPQSLGAAGVRTMEALKAFGMRNFIINLMVMDYGSPTPSVCTVGGDGRCDMGRSALQAAKNLHEHHGVPYSQIELTPMIGGNDVVTETFTLADVDTVLAFARQNRLAGVHFWSVDRDVDCPPGAASPICNTFGQAGTWGFTNRFLSRLGR
ncbi:carbohydrate-binding protein [Aquabacterium sp. A7-Y]|uniref:carbohydrate-binding protein n=1 Tax=Aquabacterium sp. A7-Y TaxID=1349605 RepID=UPI002AC8599C|nr:carbohydrate-binding protein [Aquabacterium sp. A7-Y]